jgi:hypothetical protein
VDVIAQELFLIRVTLQGAMAIALVLYVIVEVGKARR